MRGKKSDRAFVAEFIETSIQNGITTPSEMVQKAKEIIEQIEREIKAIEERKSLRSKLLDVILTFEKQTKSTSEDAKFLSFFKLEYPAMCKFICDIVRKHPIEVGEKLMPLGSGENDPTMKFSIKQLLECKVLNRAGSEVGQGERFDEYMTFVLHEVK
jgi:hypothetical protein